MGAYYAARAPTYDRIYLKPERQSDLQAMERWTPRRFAGRSVLDVACGTGYWTRFIARAAKRVVALDIEPEMLRIARGRVPEGTVDFFVGDAYALPLDAGRLDAAFAGFWFSHVPVSRRSEFLLELAGRLKPGARIVMLDNRFVEGSSSPITSRDDEGNTFQTRQLGDGSTHKVLKNFPSESDLLETVSGIGERPVITLWGHYWALECTVGRG
jgi:demethylmenaquinone methyltransferase/2-methoxy-6-polyprenyl-1,4-benzoquinol methylase